MNKKPATVDAYFAMQDEYTLPHLNEIRSIIREALPGAEEVISYGMPAFKQGKVLVYYAANKQHLGYYPTSSPMEVFADELSKYKTSKGAIQFPYDKKLPKALIKKIAKYRLQQVKEG